MKRCLKVLNVGRGSLCQSWATFCLDDLLLVLAPGVWVEGRVQAEQVVVHTSWWLYNGSMGETYV